MKDEKGILAWIDSQQQPMAESVEQWVQINTHTFNLEGLKQQTDLLKAELSCFSEGIELVDIPPFHTFNHKGEEEHIPLAPCLRLIKRPDAPKQALLVIHMDTVFPPSDSFQNVSKIEGDKINGPGVCDAKGGLIVLINSLKALEQNEHASQIGWQILINTDEEIGSPSSKDLLMKTAKNYHLGFVFEPALPNGNLIGQRKGSGNFTLIAKGKAAHAGREHHLGINAITALSECVTALDKMNHEFDDITVNCGIIQGGKAVNIVPDLAILKFNIRLNDNELIPVVEERIKSIISTTEKNTSIALQLHGEFGAPPKVFNEKEHKLAEHIQACAAELNLSIKFEQSGGVCDGNRLSAAGLPTIDTMGVVGGNMHNHNEYAELKSLVERTKLTTLCLLRWAEGKWDFT